MVRRPSQYYAGRRSWVSKAFVLEQQGQLNLSLEISKNGGMVGKGLERLAVRGKFPAGAVQQPNNLAPFLRVSFIGQ